MESGAVEITTPFLDAHNDYMQIYAVGRNGEWHLTDDGYTIRDLRASGVDVTTEKRTELLNMCIRRLGVKRKNDELYVRTSVEAFPQKKHDLVQAMLGVGDLFQTSKPHVIGIFLEEVASWLLEHDIGFVPDVRLAGKSGLSHHFDFALPRSRDRAETIVQAINRPDRRGVENFLLAWIDTRDVRSEGSRAATILNDVEGRVSAGGVEALRNYDVEPLFWSRRHEEWRKLIAN